MAQAIRGVGAGVTSRPPYRPDLNPIGEAEAKVRRQKPRTVAATEQLYGEAVD